MKHKINLLLLLVLANCILSCAKKEDSGTNPGLYDLYVYDINTGKNTRITDSPSDLENPIAFTADNKILYNNHEGIFTVNPDGSGNSLLVPLTQFDGLQLSNDGKEIAYSNGGDLYLMKYGTNVETRLTNSDLRLWSPVWSKNGNYIACSSDSGIAVVDMNGGIKIISKENTVDKIDWSSDSRKIVYAKYSGDSYSQIFVYDLQFKSDTRITSSSFYDYNASWRSGTTEVLFTSSLADYGTDLILLDLNTLVQKNIFHQIRIISPVWSPDGNKIAFINENSDIAIINADGADYKVINDIPQDCLSPIWSKDGNLILYYRAIFYTDDMLY